MAASPDPIARLDMSRTRQPIGQARHAPGAVYSSAEMLAREKRNIFEKDWLFVAREEELPNPGDYRAIDVLGEPVLVVRDTDGELRAFLNMCLHRGVQVATGAGNARRFTCPYHAWTYDTSGRLIGAAYMDDIACFNKAEARLKSVALKRWMGNVMICLDANPPPFDDFIKPFVPAAQFAHLDECAVIGSGVMQLQCNWKFAVENVMDIYHVGVVHRSSIGRTFSVDRGKGGAEDQDSSEMTALKLDDRGGMALRYHQQAATRDGNSLFGKLPWLTAEDEKKGTSGMFYLPPNFLLFAAPDVIRMLIPWPTSESTTDLHMRMLQPRERLNDPQLAEKSKIYMDYSRSVLSEDAGILQMLQKASATKRYEPGCISRLEAAVHHTVNHLVARSLAD
jgi:phenylpropionate dioxygenase-like ring-hydroxylating dioxygenase large terminal subunit